MSCRDVRALFSEYLDGELAPAHARFLTRHVESCPACRLHLDQLRETLELVADLPRESSPEPIAVRVRERLELEARRPALRELLRPARPLLRPRFAPVAVAAFCLMALPILLVPIRPTVPAPAESLLSGSESRPLSLAPGVLAPRLTASAELDDALAGAPADRTWFVETVVTRDGRVSAVRVLGGDSAYAAPLAYALRQERFEPGRFQGRPVAVSLYRLISRTEVRAPLI